MQIDFPFHFDARGRTATTTHEDHVRDLIEQLLFVEAGERVNRPDFGSGLRQLVFAPNSDALAATLQRTLQAGLNLYLADVVAVHELMVECDDATLRIAVAYETLATGARETAELTKEIGSGR